MKFSDIVHWAHQRQSKTGQKPETVPLTRDEMLEIISNAPIMTMCRHDAECSNEVAGMKPFYTPFAKEMRERTIELDTVAIGESATIDRRAMMLREQDDDIKQMMYRRLEARICQDTTKIKVTLEFDPWAKWKRRLRLIRWFPVKTRTLEIDGRVLYPYLKLSLPANRHHVLFAVL